MDRTNLFQHLNQNVRIVFWDNTPTLEGLLLPYGPIGGMMVQDSEGNNTIVQMGKLESVSTLV